MTKATHARRAADKGQPLSPVSGRALVLVASESEARSALKEGAISVRIDWSPMPGFRREPRALLCFILRVLEGKRRKMVRQHLEQFMAFDELGSANLSYFQERLREKGSLWKCAVDGMISAMRKMADMWIDSGKCRTDREIDTGADRNVEDVLPGRDCNLFLVIERSLLRSHTRDIEMTRDGSLHNKETFPRFEVNWLHLFMGFDEAMRKYGEKWAAFYFSRLLDSPDSRSLSRCDHCNSYFAYKKARLRKVYHGVSCGACVGKASGKRTERRRKMKLVTAAKAQIEWESAPRKSELWKWIAESVNKSHNTAYGRRWVSQNDSEIQARVEALRNAKT